MAISAPHYRLLKSLKPILPQGGRLLEIGEANWYGDIDSQEILRDVLGTELHHITPLERQIFEAIRSGNGFAIAKALYAALFEPSDVVAVDFNGSETAIRQDLNGELHLGDMTFDLCINHGTAEHIFNIAQVFKTMHDLTVDGGLMIHESPFTGWVDHGFYNLNPTLFYDLAAANCYEVVSVHLITITPETILRLESREHACQLLDAGQLPNNASLFVVFHKYGERPFKIPLQGYYAGALSDQGVRAWEVMR